MNDLTIQNLNNMINEESMDSVISTVLEMEQAPCPVKHIFGAGIYIREVSIAAGVFAIGHIHKNEHMNHMVKGRAIMLNDDGTSTELVAPAIYVSGPGRKVALILEDMVWHNIYPTDETDIDALEETFLDKSGVWEKEEKRQADISFLANHYNRADFPLMLDDLRLTADTVLALSENESDQIPLPPGEYKMKISKSYIQGKGVFVTSPVVPGEVIAPARIDGKRTPAGRFTNHSPAPNAEMVLRYNGDMDLIAKHDIDGCHGGDHGQEVTVDYRQVISEKGDS